MADKNMTSLTIRRPDDWHLHLRDGDMLAAVAPETARHFGRAIIMPNLVPPVVRMEDAVAYRDRIMAALPEGRLSTVDDLYLTEETDPTIVDRRPPRWHHHRSKALSRRCDTNSASGVRL